jgi:TolB protein
MKVLKQAGLCGLLLLSGGCAIGENFSPDCQLAFSSVTKGELGENIGYDIYLIDCNGENKIQLTDDLGDDYYPDWSPDGKQIVFESNRDGNREIYIMNADGSEQRNISNHPANDRWPVWSPDGEWIAFASNRDGLALDIYIQEVEGEKIYQITDDFFDNVDPTWSPDGDMIAYVQWNCPRNYLVLVSLEDLSFEEIWLNMGCISRIDWSPNGHQISYEASVGKDLDIFAVTLEDWEVVQLTKDVSDQTFMNFGAAWSPDGSQIAHVHVSIEWEDPEIYILNSDGSGNRVITNEGLWIEGIAWRP